MFQGLNLPKIDADQLSTMSPDQLRSQLKRLEEYLYQLTEQLRYTLNNLGAENMSDEFVSEVSNASAVSSLTQKVEDTERGMQSIRKQTSEGFQQVVKKDEVISAINQTAEIIKIEAGKIALEGYVTINGTFRVDENGYLRCDGGEIGGFRITNASLEADGIALDANSNGGSLRLIYNGSDVGYIGTGSGGRLYISAPFSGNSILFNAVGTTMSIQQGRIDIGNGSTQVYVNGIPISGGGSVRAGEASCSGTWRDMPSGTDGATAVSAFCSDSSGYIIKTRWSGGWQWCIDGDSGLSCSACWIAVD